MTAIVNAAWPVIGPALLVAAALAAGIELRRAWRGRGG